jgi:hypothetical protein
MLATGRNTASSKDATHNACRYDEGPRRNARERSTVIAAMTQVIRRAFATYVTTISLIGATRAVAPRMQQLEANADAKLHLPRVVGLA